MAYKHSLRSIRVPHLKYTEDCAAVTMPVPRTVSISMSQHMGPPCTPTVAVGDTVLAGQVVGDSTAFLCAPFHASVSGKVTAINDLVTAQGAVCKCVVIEADGEQTVDPSIAPPEIGDFDSFIKAVRASGLVGLGGAGFPTHVKLNPKNRAEIDTLLVNGAECEPFITSDYRTMMDDTDDVVDGIRQVLAHTGIPKAVIGIEDNKPKAIDKLRKAVAGMPIEVLPLRATYPKGAEKVLIYEATGRVVPEGKLPSDVNTIVMNVGSAAFLSRYLKTGMPLVSKKITVAGNAVAKPQNVIVPIGTAFQDIFDFCGGFREEPDKVLMGGPMMGIAVHDLQAPLLKNNNAILASTTAEMPVYEETACIRCGRCVRACPFLLMPAAIERAYESRNVELLKELKVNLCMECGCCAYSCPARRHLVTTNKLAKQLLREQGKK